MWNRWGLGLWAGLCALGLVATGGCSEESGGTRIIVTVDSDIAADADPGLTRVELTISGGTKTEMVGANVAEGETLPRQLTLRHEGGGLGPFVVTVTGTLSDGTTVTQTVRGVYFEEGGKVELSLSIDADCVGVCGGDSCRAGQCVDVVAPDGGPVDSGPDDGGADADAGEGGMIPDDSGTDADAGDTGVADAGEGGTTCEAPDDCSFLTTDCLVGVCGADGLCAAEPVDDGTGCGTAAYCIGGACTASKDCRGGTCDLTCRGNAICAYDCADASVCRLDCGGSACVVDCTAALLECNQVSCTKGSCLMLCAEATSCAFETCYGQQKSCDGGASVVCGRDCPGT